MSFHVSLCLMFCGNEQTSIDCVFPNLNYTIIMSNFTRWLSFFDSPNRLLLPPNNLRDSLARLFLFLTGKVSRTFIVAFTVLLTIFFGQTSFAQELLVNPGFESKNAGWQSNPSGTIYSSAAVKSGTYAAFINNANLTDEYFYQNINASPFGNYTFSVWAMVSNAAKWSSVGGKFQQRVLR
jgi:hypothetical protein